MSNQFIPSRYQARIFQDISERVVRSIVVSAVPGAGKTETMRQLIRFIQPQYSVLSLAFNVDAANQLGDKISLMVQEIITAGGSAPTVTSLTIHKLGNATLKAARLSKKIEKQKYNNLVKNYLASHNIYDQNFKGAVTKLVDMARLTLSGVTIELNAKGDVTRVNIDPEEVYQTVLRFDIEIDKYAEIGEDFTEWDLALKALAEVLKAGVTQARLEGTIDFTDMIWLPVILDLKPKQYDYVLVDEAQDLSPCQRTLVLSAKKQDGVFVGVGDRNQAIYGFAGASLYSLDEIKDATGAVERELSICYRCPKSVIELAAAIYPGIEAAPDAEPGVAQYITSDKVDGIVTAGDLILCRVTAPLVEMCLALLREGKRANVRGKDLGATFVNLLEKVKKFNRNFTEARFLELPEFILDYRRRQVEVLDATGAEENETKIDSLRDKVDTLLALYSAYISYFVEKSEVHSMTSFINQMEKEASYAGFIEAVKLFFAEDKDAQIILSTGHRSKGLEYNRVIILGYDEIPHKRATTPEQIRQEMNLKYVMTTRAKKELYLVVKSVPGAMVDSTLDYVEDAEEEPVEEAPALAIAEPAKRGRKATGRQQERKQYSLDPEIVARIASAAKRRKASGEKTEDGKKYDESRLLSEIIKASPLYDLLLSEAGEDPEPDGPDDPNNGGGVNTSASEEPESHEETSIGRTEALYDSTSYDWTGFGRVRRNDNQTTPEIEAEREIDLSELKTVRLFFRHKFGTCKNIWTIDYYSLDGLLFRYENGVKILSMDDPARLCPACQRRGVPKILKAKHSESHECNAVCQNATGADCTCSCGGKNHGAAHMIGAPILAGVMEDK